MAQNFNLDKFDEGSFEKQNLSDKEMTMLINTSYGKRKKYTLRNIKSKQKCKKVMLSYNLDDDSVKICRVCAGIL